MDTVNFGGRVTHLEAMLMAHTCLEWAANHALMLEDCKYWTLEVGWRGGGSEGLTLSSEVVNLKTKGQFAITG